MIRRALLGLVVCLCISAVIWSLVVDPELAADRSARLAATEFETNPGADVPPLDAKGFRTWWEQANGAARTRAVAVIVQAGAERDALIRELVATIEASRGGEHELFRALGDRAIELLWDLARRKSESTQRREGALSVLFFAAPEPTRCEYLAACIGDDDELLRSEAAFWIGIGGDDESFQGDIVVRRALCRAVANPRSEDQFPPGFDASGYYGPSPLSGQIWDALNRTLDVDGMALRELLRDGDPDVRSGAMTTVYRWFASPESAERAEPTEPSLEARARMTVEILMPMIVDPDARVRESALADLGMLAADEYPVPLQPVLDRLADLNERESVRAKAAIARARIGGDVLADLRPYLRDERPAVREAAIHGIQAPSDEMPPADLEAEFRELLDDSSAGVRAAAAAALSSYANDPAAPCRAALRNGLDDADKTVRLACARALRRPDAPPVEGVAVFVRWIRSGSAEERGEAVYAFRDMPAQAARHEEALTSLMERAENYERVRVLDALAHSARQGSTMELALKLAKDPSVDVRAAAIKLLSSRFGNRGMVVDAIKAALADSSSFVVIPAAQALKQRGLATTEVVKACIRLLEDSEAHFDHERTAILLLGECGRDARPAIPVLLRCLDQPPWLGSDVSVGVFARLPEFADQFIPPIVERAARNHTLAVAALALLETNAGKQIAAAVAKLTPEQRATLERALAEQRRPGPIKPAVRTPGR